MQASSHRRLLLWSLLPCLLGGCGASPPQPERQTPPAELTWFSVGEVEAETKGGLLAIDPYPRWFVGPPEHVSEVEIARRRAAKGKVVYEALVRVTSDEEGYEPGVRWIATVPPRPRRAEDLPTTQAGARLDLDVKPIDANELQLELTLHAGERALWRELEHRSTNVFPFLLGVEADGVPVRFPRMGSAHCGGISRFKTVVAAGASQRWTLRISRASVRGILEIASVGTPKTVGFVAVFCERKHIGWAAHDGEHPSPDTLLELPFVGDAILLRSPRVAVPWRE